MQYKITKAGINSFVYMIIPFHNLTGTFFLYSRNNCNIITK